MLRFWLIIAALIVWAVLGVLSDAEPLVRIANAALAAAIVGRMLLRRYGLRWGDLLGGARRDR